MQDEIAEMVTGLTGTVRCIGKLVLTPEEKTIQGFPLIRVVGGLVSPKGGKLVLPENVGWREMWQCEVFIIPDAKYSSIVDDSQPAGYSSATGNRCLCCGWKDSDILQDGLDPSKWGRKYFDRSKT